MIALAERRQLIKWIDLAVSEGARLNEACGIIGHGKFVLPHKPFARKSLLVNSGHFFVVAL